MSKSKKRRIILINKRFQYGLIIKFILVNIFILTIFGAFLFMFLNSEVETNLYSAHVTYQNMKDMLFPIVLTLSLINILVSSVIIAFFVFFASHRIAGPLYRFSEAIKQISLGNLKPMLTLRKKDELSGFSETLKDMADKLLEDMSGFKRIIGEIEEINKEIKNDQLGEEIKNFYHIMGQYDS